MMGKPKAERKPALAAAGRRVKFEAVAISVIHSALAAAQMQTRRYVKRQTTWLRHQAPDWRRLKTQAEIEAFLGHA